MSTIRFWHQHRLLSLLGLLLVFIVCTPSAFAQADIEFFESKVRPILVERCYECHSAEKGKTHGNLALDTKQGWSEGGDSGSAITPGNTEESLLIKAIRHDDASLRMPPNDGGGKLTDNEIAILEQWVRDGAVDPRVDAPRRGGKTIEELKAWWSFQPLKVTEAPKLPDDVVARNVVFRNDIDRFVIAQLRQQQLGQLPEADRRTLIRRATYDLIGLPPTPEEVEHFLADESPDAYERVIDRLLDSPHYGEHWGRHWLDVVRYADTAGENSDHPIPDAWRYRNWVIDSLNKDYPYDEFVRDQIAGDLIHADKSANEYAQGVIATGFLAIARRFDHDSDKHMHLTFEDTIDTIGKSFLGLSIACARCHDHKYDPISAADYYALYGILNSTRFAFPGCEAKQQPRDMVPLLPPAEWAAQIVPFEREIAQIDQEINRLRAEQDRISTELNAKIGEGTVRLAEAEVPEGQSRQIEQALVDDAGSIEVKRGDLLQLTVDPNGNYGADTTIVDWEITEVEGESKSWNLTKDVVGDFLKGNPHSDAYGNGSVWCFLDARKGFQLLSEVIRDSDGKQGLHVWRTGENPAVFVNSTEVDIAAWTKLPAKTLFVHPAMDGAVAIGWLSPIDGRVRVTGAVSDGHPGGPNGVKFTLERRRGDISTAIEAMSVYAAKLAELRAKKDAVSSSMPKREFAYAVIEGTSGNAKLHLRGDPEKLGEEIPRRWLEIFGSPKITTDKGSGRLELAHWLTDPANPLVSRTIVNRVWLYHFGKGIVPTPNDLGTRGELPTHPELLDFLANRLIEDGWKLKSLHRLIMLSATYRQASHVPSTDLEHNRLIRQASEVDPNNRLYWRYDSRRLNAEQIRDSLLVVSNRIDLKPGEFYPLPPPTSWSYTQHVPFAGVPETNQRTIYQMIVRNRRSPFLGLFDGADPNATTALRQVTTVPTQSLYFMNDPGYHENASAVARRALQLADDPARVTLMYRILFQRAPRQSEIEAATEFLKNYETLFAAVPPQEKLLETWSAYARVLMSSNEFIYLD